MTINQPIRRRTVLGAAAGAAFVPLAGAGTDLGGRGIPDLVGFRRDLHAHPEVSGQEARTASVVAERLRAAGLDVTTDIGGHGVVGVLSGARRGRTVAYRADMDAVPPEGQIGGGTATAHCCGHDLHTTIGVGVAEALARGRRHLNGRFVFVFQPGEETLSGAAAMLADHVLDRHAPSEIHGLHCGPFPVGTLLATTGYGLSGLDRGQVTITTPDGAERATALAAELNALGTVTFPTTTAEFETIVRDLQTPGGPLSQFVYMRASAAGAQVRASFRCWPEGRYVEIRDRIRALAGSAADVSFPAPPFPAMITPEREGKALQRYLEIPALHAAIPFNGEDFALFLQRIPGTFSFLGVRKPGAAVETSYPHHPRFDPDERAIGHGVRAMTDWLAHRARVAP